MTTVWSGVIVEDSNLPTQISALRRILDRGPSQGSCIQTISGRGYRFVAPVTHPALGGGAAASPAGCAPAENGGSSPPRARALAVFVRPPLTRALLHSRGVRRRPTANPTALCAW